MSFRVGQRVRYTWENPPIRCGSLGTVVRTGRHWCAVDFDFGERVVSVESVEDAPRFAVGDRVMVHHHPEPNGYGIASEEFLFRATVTRSGEHGAYEVISDRGASWSVEEVMLTPRPPSHEEGAKDAHEEWKRRLTEDAHKMADSYGWCEEFDEFMVAHGLEPRGRARLVEVTLQVVTTVEVQGRNPAQARGEAGRAALAAAVEGLEGHLSEPVVTITNAQEASRAHPVGRSE